MAFNQFGNGPGGDTGGGGGDFQRPKFQGNWTCSDCGAAITELPFEPKPDRPIRCLDCHKKFKQSQDR